LPPLQQRACTANTNAARINGNPTNDKLLKEAAGSSWPPPPPH